MDSARDRANRRWGMGPSASTPADAAPDERALLLLEMLQLVEDMLALVDRLRRGDGQDRR